LTTISIFRTSFLWVETVPAVLAGACPNNAPSTFLGRYGDYAAEFDRCQEGRPTGRLTLPWSSPRGNFYWKYYFEGKHAGEMTGVQAWKKLVPFRMNLDCATATKDAEVRVSFEAFYFPHGIGVVARANYRGQPKSALEVARLALAVRYTYRFQIAGSSTAGGFNLDQAAECALAVARERGFGKVDGFPGDNQPFSVTTFLVGQNIAPLAPGSDEHFLLETTTAWNHQLKAVDLAKLPLADARLSIRNGDDDNIMYGRKYGRAIWLTRAFDQNPDTPTLACYHRNVTHASLQTLSLGEFVSWTAAQYDAQAPVHPAVVDRAKRAASLLQLLFDGKTASGKKVTYRTASVAEQIATATWGTAMTVVKALP
jgi:hypothetical protein